MFLTRPAPLPILVCDGIHLDPATRRKSLLGLFAESFPLAVPLLWFVAPFTGAQGVLTLTLRMTAPSGEEVFEVGGLMTCGDAGSSYDFMAQVAGLVFAGPSAYLVEALADGVPFVRREFGVFAKAPAATLPAAPEPSAS